MRDAARETRRKQIAEAALALLETHGYAGTTMQAVARKAGASMETLYSWYGDKTGLYRALVAHNASDVRLTLEALTERDCEALEILGAVGPKLLALLTGEASISLNRAAASDPTGELGAAIAEAGRETIAPMIEKLFQRAAQQGLPGVNDAREATEIYLGLLIGDLQIRRVIGQLKPLSRAACAKRSERASSYIKKLFGSQQD